MRIAHSADGFVATISGLAGTAAWELVEALASLAGGATRAAVLVVAGDGPPQPADGLRALALVSLPTVAAVTGTNEGGAFEVALACDIRVCGDDATFVVPEEGGRHRVLAPDLTAGVYGAEQALTAGLATELVPHGDVLRRAEEIAATIARRGPIATRMAKEALWRGIEMPLAQALRFETDLTLLLQTTKDRAEGVCAFLEKRPPAFVGE